eukprot:COSAG06_NODE_54846_length_292_cov_1.264249_1_plen_32_part_01
MGPRSPTCRSSHATTCPTDHAAAALVPTMATR